MKNINDECDFLVDVCYYLALILLLHVYKFQVDSRLIGMTETIQCEFLVDVCFFAVFEPNHHL